MPTKESPYWFNSLGNTAHLTKATKTEVNFGFKKPGSRKVSARLEILKLSGNMVGKFHVTTIIYHKGGGKSVNERIFTGVELGTAFDVNRSFTTNNPDFAQEFFADRGIPGIFILSQARLNIPCPGSGLEGDPNLSIAVDSWMEKPIAVLLGLR